LRLYLQGIADQRAEHLAVQDRQRRDFQARAAIWFSTPFTARLDIRVTWLSDTDLPHTQPPLELEVS
jgi:hypothetical protein